MPVCLLMCLYSIRAIVSAYLSVTKPAHHMLNVVECLSCIFQWMPRVFNIWLFSIIAMLLYICIILKYHSIWAHKKSGSHSRKKFKSISLARAWFCCSAGKVTVEKRTGCSANIFFPTLICNLWSCAYRNAHSFKKLTRSSVAARRWQIFTLLWLRVH